MSEDASAIEFRAAEVAIFFTRAILGSADTSRKHLIRLIPPGDVLTQSSAAGVLASHSKPVFCTPHLDDGLNALSLAPVPSDRSDPVGLAALFTAGDRAHLSKPEAKVLLRTGTERLACPVFVLERFCTEYVMNATFLWTVRRPSIRDRLAGITVVVQPSPATLVSFRQTVQ